MQEKFLRQITDFIFVENPPKRADLILIPGSGYPQIAEEAARLYKDGYAPLILPSGRYSILKGKFAGVWEKKELYGGDYETEWEFLISLAGSFLSRLPDSSKLSIMIA